MIVGGNLCSIIGGDVVPVDSCDLNTWPGHWLGCLLMEYSNIYGEVVPEDRCEDRTTNIITTVDPLVIAPWPSNCRSKQIQS